MLDDSNTFGAAIDADDIRALLALPHGCFPCLQGPVEDLLRKRDATSGV